MGDRIVVLEKGVIQQVDSPEEIYNNPTNTFVAGRLAMTCCADDIQLVGHLGASQHPIQIKNKQWIHLRARVHYMYEYEGSQPEIILELLKYEEIEEIENPIVSLV